MDHFVMSEFIDAVRRDVPLVHCITNCVTVNDCANAVLACGGSPIMSDEPKDVEDITSICSSLLLNIGTLNERTIGGMRRAGALASDLGHPIVLDPVGAGASCLRTDTAIELVESLDISVIRGNMSEAKAISGVGARTRGVDADPGDAIGADNLDIAAEFARELSARTGAIVVITGEVDVVADSGRAFAVFNGSPLMGRMTGAGCMLSCVCAAYAGVAVSSDGNSLGQGGANDAVLVHETPSLLDAMVSCVAQFGIAGEIAASRMSPQDGNGSFRMYLLDALFNMDAQIFEQYARVREVV